MTHLELHQRPGPCPFRLLQQILRATLSGPRDPVVPAFVDRPGAGLAFRKPRFDVRGPGGGPVLQSVRFLAEFPVFLRTAEPVVAGEAGLPLREVRGGFLQPSHQLEAPADVQFDGATHNRSGPFSRQLRFPP